jgi:hypothetical protein
MRKMILVFCALSLMAICVPSTTDAGVSVGMTVTDEGLKSFHVAIGDYYQIPDKEIVVVRKRHIPDEELPVVFFLAARAKVAPGVIIDLRLKNKSWMEITRHFGLGAEVYYVPVKQVSGPPYGKAYGHFKNKNKKEWGKIALADADIVNFVNLKFVSEHYGYSPDEVIKMRSGGKSFVNISAEVKKNKAKKQKEAKAYSQKDKKQNSKGKGKRK